MNKKFLKNGLIALIIASGSLLSACQSVNATTNSTVANKEANASTLVSTETSTGNLVEYEENDSYAEWQNGQVTHITLSEDTISSDGDGSTVNGKVLTISSAGTYVVSGKLTDGSIIVDAGKEAEVRLILNGVDISCSTSSPLYVKQAKKVVVSLEAGTTNTFSDGKSYTANQSTTEDAPNATIYSKDDLTFNGTGALVVKANYNNAITSKDTLKFMEGKYTITSADDGIIGKDLLAVKTGEFNIKATGDAMKATNDTDETKGIVVIQDGQFDINAEADGIQASNNVYVQGGAFKLITGGGSANSTKTHTEKQGFGGGMRPEQKAESQSTTQNAAKTSTTQKTDINSKEITKAKTSASQQYETTKTSTSQTTKVATSQTTGTTEESDESTSTKGIKAEKGIYLEAGTFTFDTADDAIHSSDKVTINKAALQITSGDDGIHADIALNISGGTVDITKSYEGLESADIHITGGQIHVTASDDGVNATGGNDNSLTIDDGYLVVDSMGDGLDANGSITMNGGTVVVYGPTNDGNGSLDYDTSFNITGGILVAAGSAGMAQTPSDTSSQYTLEMTYSATQEAGNMVHLEDSEGKTIITFAPTKAYRSVVISSPLLTKDGSYTLYSGGSMTGEKTDGIYQSGTYKKADKGVSFTIADKITYLSESGVTIGNVAPGRGGFRGIRGNGQPPTRPEGTTPTKPEGTAPTIPQGTSTEVTTQTN